ncbi:MAG: hypothetical protein HN904_18265 [Victivallales bacterium]|nr:hypothetical protein [Victivallales bacterium]MBT7164731.1 hypothetical protein [Victivallales bacterium]
MQDQIPQSPLAQTCRRILAYLADCQDTTPGEYFGSFWSEKGYHGPLLDYHAGGSHHHRTAGSAALALWQAGVSQDRADWRRAAELGFDWLAARQSSRGGYPEIQNNEVPADWEGTGREELSAIAMGFVAHGLGHALLAGLPPKKTYLDCLDRAGHWQLSLEWPAASGVFPHHERSPYNTLNAASHAAETMALAYTALDQVFGRRINIFQEGARRAIENVLACQWESGCFPYRDYGHITINYTSLVVWCLLNCLDALRVIPPRLDRTRIEQACQRASDFLRTCIAADGQLLWEGNETSTAKRNIWTYAITANVLARLGGEANEASAARLVDYLLANRAPDGLLPMRDYGETITECAFMQADMYLFLQPLTGLGTA